MHQVVPVGVIVGAVALAGCASGGPGTRNVPGGGTSHAAAGRSQPAARSGGSPGPVTGSPPPTDKPLQGKYQANAIAFPSRHIGIAAISGYAGDSATLSSWIARTTDGGRRWAASRPVTGPHQPGAQAGLAFASTQQGWAYSPGLFFTRDGGATWQAEHTPFPLTGQVAVAGTSAWVAGYPCVHGDCPATIYTADRVGGPLTRLPDQPPASGSIVAMGRPAASVAWLLIAGPGGRQRLVTTSDSGRSWSARPLPCGPGGPGPDQLSVTGSASLWLVCVGTPGAGSVPGVLYRTVDGARTWTRIAREDSLRVYAVNNRVAWAVEDNASGNLLVRTLDGGRTWHTVLSSANAAVEAFVPQGTDGAQAVVRVLSAKGERFVAYRTRDAGRTWQRAALPA